MHDRKISAQHRALEERLCIEAQEPWPVYSETLHRRIMSAVRRQTVEAAAPRQPSAAKWLRRGWAAALTAACLLGAAVFGWRLNVYGPQLGIAIDPPPSLAVTATISDLALIDELASGAADHLSGLIATAAMPQSEELQLGTRQVAETLLCRLPIDVELIAGP